MIGVPPTRVQYLAKKVETGVATQGEKDELARLLGHDPTEFAKPEDALLLLAIALAAIAAGLIIAYVLTKE